MKPFDRDGLQSGRIDQIGVARTIAIAAQDESNQRQGIGRGQGPGVVRRHSDDHHRVDLSGRLAAPCRPEKITCQRGPLASLPQIGTVTASAFFGKQDRASLRLCRSTDRGQARRLCRRRTTDPRQSTQREEHTSHRQCSAKATQPSVRPAPPTGTTMYCLPSDRYVIGAPVAPAGRSCCHTTRPVILSIAAKLARAVGLRLPAAPSIHEGGCPDPKSRQSPGKRLHCRFASVGAVSHGVQQRQAFANP